MKKMVKEGKLSFSCHWILRFILFKLKRSESWKEEGMLEV